MGALIVDYGIKKNVHSYRICGSKEEIYKLLDEAREDGNEFADTPNVLHVHRGQWTVVVHFKAKVEVGKNDKIH